MIPRAFVRARTVLSAFILAAILTWTISQWRTDNFMPALSYISWVPVSSP